MKRKRNFLSKAHFSQRKSVVRTELLLFLFELQMSETFIDFITPLKSHDARYTFLLHKRKNQVIKNDWRGNKAFCLFY